VRGHPSQTLAKAGLNLRGVSQFCEQQTFNSCQYKWSPGHFAGIILLVGFACPCIAQSRLSLDTANFHRIVMLAALQKAEEKRAVKVMQHASGDKRFKILEAHMKKHLFRQDALIEVLHKAQELFGFLDDDLLLFISCKLKLPASRVYGVATFYHFFTLKPQGKHTCVVCMGTACYVKGGDKVLAMVQEEAKIKAGETTPDGKVSILTARCIGACGIAPAVVYDGTVTPRQTPESALQHVKGWLKNGS
jgi:bidirectional [NiFe] hydrogenase diaphorase subunit